MKKNLNVMSAKDVKEIALRGLDDLRDTLQRDEITVLEYFDGPIDTKLEKGETDSLGGTTYTPTAVDWLFNLKFRYGKEEIDANND